MQIIRSQALQLSSRKTSTQQKCEEGSTTIIRTPDYFLNILLADEPDIVVAFLVKCKDIENKCGDGIV